MRLTTPDYGVNRLLDVTSSDSEGDFVSLEQAKLWLRKDGDDEDALIEDLVNESVSHSENVLNRSLIAKTYTATWSSFSAEVPVPFSPIDEIISIHRIDKGEEVEITDYYVIADRIRFDKTYGVTNPYYQQGLKVVYKAKADDVPVKSAIKQMILTNYEDRQDNADQIMEVPSNSRKKLMRYKRYVN